MDSVWRGGITKAWGISPYLSRTPFPMFAARLQVLRCGHRAGRPVEASSSLRWELASWLISHRVGERHPPTETEQPGPESQIGVGRSRLKGLRIQRIVDSRGPLPRG